MIVNDIIRQDYIEVDKNDVISRLIGKMRLSKKNDAVVVDGKKYAGVVSKRKMLKGRRDVSEEKIHHILMKPAVLTGEESLEKACQLMNTSDTHMLPVVKKGAVAGVVYAIDLVKSLAGSIGDRKVSDVSSGKIIAFHQHLGIGKVMHEMRMKKIDHAPLVNDSNKLSGIVSAVDLLLKYEIFPPRRAGGRKVKGIMGSAGKERDLMQLPIINDAVADVVTVRKDDTVATAIGLMDKHRISDVVVMDEFNQPMGIVTLKDLLKLF